MITLFTVLLYITRMFFKHDIYKYFMSGRDLDCKILLLYYKYSNRNSFHIFRNLNSDYDCHVQSKRVAFSTLLTLMKCCVWKVCVDFGHPSVKLILNKMKVKCRVIDIILREKSTGRVIIYSGITKIYYRKTVGYIFTKHVQIEGTTQNFFFPSKLFFIVVHISAARQCECI